jgi:hypothetical protein
MTAAIASRVVFGLMILAGLLIWPIIARRHRIPAPLAIVLALPWACVWPIWLALATIDKENHQ